ncbi:MAG TPA: AraC family transcriptional regulator [Polyangiaceae bacterium]|jgi:AraC-like DNA-binding protein|nr:AraC family transcriptional regulator [Polyangiaceae bacterium]
MEHAVRFAVETLRSERRLRSVRQACELIVIGADGRQPRELIQYRRSAAVPGIELLDAEHSPREWRLISPCYGLCFQQTWRGRVSYRGRVGDVTPAHAFCAYADEPIVAVPAQGIPGSFKSLIIAPDLIRNWVLECQTRTLPAEWRTLFPAVSPNLLTTFRAFSDALQPGTSDLELQSSTADLAQAIVSELIAGASDAPPRQYLAVRPAMRMRECLEEAGLNVDLETLAQAAKLDRFQALRAFKKCFGLPPHAYQLRLRVARARILLLEGAAPADVAARCGFTDQSHMIRHFKRIVGVTPSQYAGKRKARARAPK